LLPWLHTSLLAVKMKEKEKCQKFFFKMLKHFFTKFLKEWWFNFFSLKCWSKIPAKIFIQHF
jgi:inorganic pyrophosphatase